MQQPAVLDAKNEAHEQDRLHGGALLTARIVLGATLLLSLSLFAISVPFEYARNISICRSAICGGVQLSTTYAGALHHLGLSLNFYATYVLVGEVLLVVVYTVVAGLIAWRRSDDRTALFVAITLITWSVGAFIPSLGALRTSQPFWSFPVALLASVGGASFICFCYVFPNGRFVPRWTRWSALGWSLLYVPHGIAPGSRWDISTLPFIVQMAFWACFHATVTTAQVYRYRHVSTALERQQVKWVLLDIIIIFLALVGLVLAIIVSVPSLGASAMFVAAFLGLPIVYLAALLIPTSIVIAMLRHQLFDVDVLLNRTLVYGALTAALALVYAVCVITFQVLLSGFTRDSQLAVVTSTLIIAALFRPLRRRLQSTIDRHFYRRKYDAVRTLAEFGATLRSEVDLTTLSSHLVAVIEETVQPAHVSLWLRPIPSHPEDAPERLS
jgi:hypothetical protein